MINILLGIVCPVAAYFAGRYLRRYRDHLDDGRAIGDEFDALSTEHDEHIRPRALRYDELSHDERLALQADIEDWMERKEDVCRRSERWMVR